MTRLQRGILTGYRLTKDSWSPGLALRGKQRTDKQVVTREDLELEGPP